MKKFIDLRLTIAKDKPNTVSNPNAKCPFCDWETLKKTNKIIEAKENMMWMENKFPTLKDTYQTVIVEHNECGRDLSNYKKEHLYEMMEFILDCWEKLKKSGIYRSVLLFKNHGTESDATIRHSHMQIVGLKEIDYRENVHDGDFEGIIIEKKNGVEWNVSVNPTSESYEFNIIVRKENYHHQFSDYLQNTADYILNDLNKKYESFNIAFYELNDKLIAKVYSRKPISIYEIGYNLILLPDNLTDVAENLKKKYILE